MRTITMQPVWAAALMASVAVTAQPAGAVDGTIPRPAPVTAAPLETPPAAAPASFPAPALAAPAPAAAAVQPTSLPAPAPRSTATPSSPATKLPPDPIKLAEDPRPTFSPQTFVATMQAAERYRIIAATGGWTSLPNEVTRLKPSDPSPLVSSLKKRLMAEGDLQPHELPGLVFDESMTAGVKRFQARHGLEPTGLIGPRTLVHLNIPAATRVRQLEESAARLIGSKFPFGERYVVVNIPGAAVEAVERGTVARRFVAVVGRTERPSPQVETRITSVNFNPTWTVPVSIIKKDIIPHVRKDPGYLAKMHIRLFDGQGQEVPASSIDWSTERAANYTVRQDAGVDNSLGEIRIDMPNRHAVYLHDTPSKKLFARSLRAHSSGCVRVSGVKDLAGWLLQGAAGPRGAGTSWTAMEMETAIAGGTRIDARLQRSVPVAWVYLTGYASPDGTVHFRDDIYGLDDAKVAVPPAAEPATTSSTTPALQKQATRNGTERM